MKDTVLCQLIKSLVRFNLLKKDPQRKGETKYVSPLVSPFLFEEKNRVKTEKQEKAKIRKSIS